MKTAISKTNIFPLAGARHGVVKAVSVAHPRPLLVGRGKRIGAIHFVMLSVVLHAGFFAVSAFWQRVEHIAPEKMVAITSFFDPAELLNEEGSGNDVAKRAVAETIKTPAIKKRAKPEPKSPKAKQPTVAAVDSAVTAATAVPAGEVVVPITSVAKAPIAKAPVAHAPTGTTRSAPSHVSRGGNAKQGSGSMLGRRALLRQWKREVHAAARPALEGALKHRLLRRLRLSGTMAIAIVVDESGRVRRARVRRSSGNNDVDQVMLQQLTELRRVPAPPKGLGWERIWNKAELTVPASLVAVR